MVTVDERGSKLNQPPATPSFDRKYANRMLVLFSILAGSVMYVEIMLTPALPKISDEYGITSAEASLILSLYTVFGTAINPVVGKLGDIFGKKKILTYVLVAYCVAATFTSFAPNYTTLLLTRTFQGVGLSIFPLAFSLVREQFPRDLVPRAQGILSAMFGAGLAIGLPAGAFVANNLSWQANYHIATPFIVVLTVIIIYTVRESIYRNPKAKLDYYGAGLLGVSLALMVLGLSEGSSWGWTSARILGLFITGGTILVPLVLIERKQTDPLLNFKQLGSRNVLISNITGVVVGMGMFLMFQAIVYQLENPKPAGYGFDVFTAGLYLLPMALTMLVVMFPVGVLISKIGTKPFIFLGSTIGAIGFLLMSTVSRPAQIPEYLTIASVGMAMLMVSIQNLLVLSVKPHEMGLATAMNTVFRNVGSSLGAPIAGSILSTFTFLVVIGNTSLVLPTETAFKYTYYIAAVAFLVALFAAFFAREVIGTKASNRLATSD